LKDKDTELIHTHTHKEEEIGGIHSEGSEVCFE